MNGVKCKNCRRYIHKWCHIKIDSPDPDLIRDCVHFGQRTNYDRIRIMDIEEMAKFLIDETGWDCNNCSEHHRLSDTPLRFEKCDEKCVYHCVEWLNQEVTNNE